MNIALVLAGGVGLRTGYSVPKQYMTIYDKPIIVYTLENLQSSNLFDEIYVVCADEWKTFVSAYAKQYEIKAFISTIKAGESRNETVANGIKYLAEHNKNGDDNVCIFDSVRPIVPHNVLEKSINALNGYDCVVAMIPTHDCLFYVDSNTNIVSGRIENSTLYLGLTPMVARLKDTIEAINYTEEGKYVPLTVAMMKLGKKIREIEGSSKSIKITTAEDFAIVKALLQKGD